MALLPLAGLAETLSAVDACRFAAGIHIPNWDLRDWNAVLFTRTNYPGEDGKTWKQAGFRSWYYYGSSAGYSLNQGTAGVVVPKTRWSNNAMRMAALASTTAIDIQNHAALANCTFSELLPFSRFFPSHYGKPITLALTFRSNSPGSPTWVYGSHLVAYLGCFDANFNWLDSEELVFEDDAALIVPTIWQTALAHTATALPSGTAYIQLHIGIRGDGADTHVFEMDGAALMLNPTVVDAAGGASPEFFIDLDTVFLEITPALSRQAGAVSDHRMLDGHLYRNNTMKGGPFPTLSLQWWKEDAATLQKLYLAWLLSTQGLGGSVPEAVPICVDAGVGILPSFGYWHATGPFQGNFNAYWTAAGGGYDIGLTLLGV